jgi:uncharacterized protein with PIN domain
MKLLLSKELGRLARWLRILGFDTAYFAGDNLSSLLIQALKEERIILTRNQRLTSASGTKVILIKDQTLKDQIRNILSALEIGLDPDLMFKRCILCNMQLVKVDKEKVKDRVPEYVFKTTKDFTSCPKCRRIYWQGSHWGNVKDTLKNIGSL